MASGSFAHFTSQNKSLYRADGLSLSFICGQTLQQCENVNSNVNLAVDKIGAFYKSSDIMTLTISMYDATGSLLSTDKIAHKYTPRLSSISPDYQVDECFPHCHGNTDFTLRQTIAKSVVASECRHVLNFLRKHRDHFKHLKTMTFICCHYITIPDDVDFLLQQSPDMTLIQKLDHTGTGPVFDLSETPRCHGYTPWRYRASLTIDDVAL